MSWALRAGPTSSYIWIYLGYKCLLWVCHSSGTVVCINCLGPTGIHWDSVITVWHCLRIPLLVLGRVSSGWWTGSCCILRRQTCSGLKACPLEQSSLHPVKATIPKVFCEVTQLMPSMKVPEPGVAGGLSVCVCVTYGPCWKEKPYGLMVQVQLCRRSAAPFLPAAHLAWDNKWILNISLGASYWEGWKSNVHMAVDIRESLFYLNSFSAQGIRM